MSTSEEVHEELPPEPLEVITSFLSINQRLIELVTQAHSSPSIETLTTAEASVLNARGFLGAFHKRQFFRDSDPADMEAAVSSIMVAAQEVAQTSHKINAEQPIEITFGGDFKNDAIEGLKNEETAEAASERLCNIYANTVSSAYEALLTSESVASFALRISQRQEKIKRLKYYGGTALAAFAGTFLANYVQKRKNDTLSG
jgi:hypothetical protein